jgi:hypothetical protein
MNRDRRAVWLSAALAAGLRVESAGRPFTNAGQSFLAGSLLLLSGRNSADVASKVDALARAHGVTSYGLDESWMSSGQDLGSPRNLPLRRPRVAIAWDDPVAAAAGTQGWPGWQGGA